MSGKKKRVLVVGGGFSGIGSIKCLKEEGLDPVCYEKTAHHGGTWYYREDTPDGIPSIMPSTVINHSKEMGALSNFVPDKNYPNYMKHHQLYQMLNEIAVQFDCLKHIVYNREVLRLERCEDYKSTGRWSAVVKNTVTGEVVKEIFDAVMIGVGHFTFPKLAEFPGMDKFQGAILHTHNLKGVEKFRDQKVAVIGIGCSGLDAATEVSSVASKVYLSTRSGTWVLPRVGVYGLPFDYAMLRRFGVFMRSCLGFRFASRYMEKHYIEPKFNHNLYNLRPAYPALSKDPSTNDLLPSRIISGAVQMRKNIKCFTEKGVIFENETHVTDVDTAIMATGYKWQFAFLEDDIIRVDEGRIDLYRCVFPPHLEHPTLGVVGFILPWGPGFPLGEMQCRWIARVFSGSARLPSEETMMHEIETRHKNNVARYVPSDKISIRVDYIEYLDQLADEIGARPCLWKLMFTDFELFWALAFGPSLPYQYRLVGPHKWDGARRAILTAHERVRYPLSGNFKKPKPQGPSLGVFLKYFFVLLFLTFWLQHSEQSLKCYVVALIIPWMMSWKGFYRRLIFCLLILPFVVHWDGFVSSYFVTLIIPVLLASL